ncbi:choice-of-anchor G family protein [Microbacterium esteraromaticum]|uniref:Choice-of-anchor G family protein n=1 Tax=Microbacterium esteraromaticum TaxID=57043 RepID=A0A7D7WFJ4_9MICO|nr:choice-of-anchor G family protein [Microbacterium esteraromaticum]QMU97392.1 choice-of-anchor G family protein [Microbacterium esteraromaticum]
MVEATLDSVNPPSGLSRRTVMKGAAWTVPALMVATAAPAYAASPQFCAPVGTKFDAQARGRMVSGAIGGVNLDAIASVNGAHATAFGTTATDTESSALSVTALQALTLNFGTLTGAVSNLLDLTTGQNAGALNQFARANESVGGPTLADVGASGAVNQDSGALTLNNSSPNPPELGSVDLRSLLAQLTGNTAAANLVASVSDLKLRIGASAGRTSYDSLCVTPAPGELTRDYLIAYLRLVIQTAVVGQLIGGISTGLNGTTISVSTQALLDALKPIPVLGPIIAGVGAALATVNSTITVNTAQLTQQSIPNAPNAALAVHPSEGTITLDVASLLGGAYTGDISEWLNSRGPNTRLFVDAGLPAGGIAAVLDQWVNALVDRLTQLATVDITITAVGIVRIRVQGTLADLLAGNGTVAVEVPNLLPPFGWTPLAGVNLGAVAAAVGGVVRGAIAALFNSQTGALRGTLDVLNVLLSNLFSVLSGVLAITVNAQNSAGGTVPAYYQAITPVGRYDVAALHLELLGVAGGLLNLSVARGSSGENNAR